MVKVIIENTDTDEKTEYNCVSYIFAGIRISNNENQIEDVLEYEAEDARDLSYLTDILKKEVINRI